MWPGWPRSPWAGAARALMLYFTLMLCLIDKPAWSRIEKVNYRQKEKQVLDSILGKGYDKRIRPSGRNDTVWSGSPDVIGASFWDGPTTVTVNCMIRSISKIDDYKMEYSVQVTFREQWNDERLRYYDDTMGRLKYLTLTDPTKVWMPDTFFRNEKEARKHEIIVPNVYVRIFPTGEILYSIRISLTLACPMDLRLYPLDKQVCVLQIASYGWAKDDLIYKWKDKDPVQVVPGLHLPRFTLEQYKSAYCDVITNTGEYSCLKVELIFKREFSYYLITIYVPCCMLVIVSWVSFWLDQNAIPARVSLGVTTLLTMSTQTSGINAQLPPVSYTKAIDVWTGVCQCFVFCALLEFALVNYASRSDMQRDRARERMERARRQWELEHADLEATTGAQGTAAATGSGGVAATDASGEGTAGSNGAGTAPATSGTGGANGGGGLALNHIGSSTGLGLTAQTDGIPGFPTSAGLKKRSSEQLRHALRDLNGPLDNVYRSTTAYPHPTSGGGAHASLDDLTFGFGQPSSLSYMLPPELGRPCEVHMNSTFPGGLAGSRGHPAAMATASRHGGFASRLEQVCTYILCCGTRGLLSKFPSRAKRIDVISRFIFPLIFAIFNLAYWLYYLFAKSKSPQLDG